MDETVEAASTDVVSAVSDLHSTRLRVLIYSPSPQVRKAVDRVLDIEARGLQKVASFNASLDIV